MMARMRGAKEMPSSATAGRDRCNYLCHHLSPRPLERRGGPGAMNRRYKSESHEGERSVYPGASFPNRQPTLYELSLKLEKESLKT